jgi:hypothetical protein
VAFTWHIWRVRRSAYFGNFLTTSLETSSDIFLGPSCPLEPAGRGYFSRSTPCWLSILCLLINWRCGVTARYGILTPNAPPHCCVNLSHWSFEFLYPTNLSEYTANVLVRFVSTSRMARSPVRDVQKLFGVYLFGTGQRPGVPD